MPQRYITARKKFTIGKKFSILIILLCCDLIKGPFFIFYYRRETSIGLATHQPQIGLVGGKSYFFEKRCQFVLPLILSVHVSLGCEQGKMRYFMFLTVLANSLLFC